MDELRDVLNDLRTKLNEAIERAHRAGYVARGLGLPMVDQHIEDDLLPVLLVLADESPEATHPGSVGHLLTLLEEGS